MDRSLDPSTETETESDTVHKIIKVSTTLPLPQWHCFPGHLVVYNLAWCPRHDVTCYRLTDATPVFRNRCEVRIMLCKVISVNSNLTQEHLPWIAHKPDPWNLLKLRETSYGHFFLEKLCHFSFKTVTFLAQEFLRSCWEIGHVCSCCNISQNRNLLVPRM